MDFKFSLISVPDACPWLSSTQQNDVLKCNDGTYCNRKIDKDGAACCINHGGRMKCYKDLPVMCAQKNCAAYSTDYCCETEEVCKELYGGVRSCGTTEKGKLLIPQYNDNDNDNIDTSCHITNNNIFQITTIAVPH